MSEARFVCAVIRDRAGRILFERRSQNVGHFAGLWCTPGGAIDEGETAEEAIRREIREETGIELSALERMPDVVRRSGTIAFFASHPADHETRILEPEFIDELAWFRIDELPERLVLESVLGLAPLLEDQLLATVVDRTFSALFYAHAEPLLRASWPSNGTTDVLFHTVHRTPWRKFRAGIPLLATRGNAAALLPALAAEVLFSFFYVYDDLLDGKKIRYGVPTALGALGYDAATEFVNRFEHSFGAWLQTWPTSIARQKIATAASKHMTSLRQHEHGRRNGAPVTMAQYERASAMRTAFLGWLWEIAAESVDDAALAELWREIYPLCAVVGQLKNDLRELDPQSESYSEDTRSGTITAVTMMLRNLAASISDDNAAASVHAQVTSRCRDLIATIINAIRDAPIDHDARVVLEAWVHMQFENGLAAGENMAVIPTATFLRAVARSAEGVDYSKAHCG